MAYGITAANVIPSANASLEVARGGSAIAAGDAVYYDTTLQQWFKADADNATAASGGSVAPNAGVDGVAVSACAGANCCFVVCRTDDLLAIGATTTDIMASGEVGVLSGTAGAVQPAPADSGDVSIAVWIAMSTTEVKLIKKTGGAVA